MSTKLTALDLVIAADTLHGSLAIADRADAPLFKMTKEARKATLQRFHDVLGQTSIELEDEPEEGWPPLSMCDVFITRAVWKDEHGPEEEAIKVMLDSSGLIDGYMRGPTDNVKGKVILAATRSLSVPVSDGILTLVEKVKDALTEYKQGDKMYLYSFSVKKVRLFDLDAPKSEPNRMPPLKPEEYHVLLRFATLRVNPPQKDS